MCFSLMWFRDVLIWFVALAVIVALLKILLPWLFQHFGVDAGILLRIIDIVVWGVVAIFVIYLVFALIACFMGAGGGLPLFPRGR